MTATTTINRIRDLVILLSNDDGAVAIIWDIKRLRKWVGAPLTFLTSSMTTKVGQLFI